MNPVQERLLSELLRKDAEVLAGLTAVNTSANFLLVLATFVPAEIAHFHSAGGAGHLIEIAAIVLEVCILAATLASIWPRDTTLADADITSEQVSSVEGAVREAVKEIASEDQIQSLVAARVAEIQISTAEERIHDNSHLLARKQLALTIALWCTALCLAATALLALSSSPLFSAFHSSSSGAAQASPALPSPAPPLAPRPSSKAADQPAPRPIAPSQPKRAPVARPAHPAAKKKNPVRKRPAH